MKGRTVIIKIFAACMFSMNALSQTTQPCSSPFCFESLEIQAGIPYYFMNSPETPLDYDFSYQAGIAANKYYRTVKFSMGIIYNGKNFTYHVSDPRIFLRSENRVRYINVPIIVSLRVAGTSKQNLSINAGLIFLRPFNCSRDTYFMNDSVSSEKSIPVRYTTGIAARLGTRYSVQLNPSFHFFTEFNGDWKFKLDYFGSSGGLGGPSSGQYQNLTDDRFSINLQIGVEFYFKRQD